MTERSMCKNVEIVQWFHENIVLRCVHLLLYVYSENFV